MDDFFSFGSKAVLIVPVVILILALVLRFNQTGTGPVNQSLGLINQTPTIIPVAQINKNNSFKFDLNGPIVCKNLFIKNKEVLYEDGQSNYLLNGDCLYQWQTGKFSGAKKCGLAGYIGLAENYLGSMSISDLANNGIVSGLAKEKKINITDVLSSCKRGEIKDEGIFAIPTKILFKAS